MASLRNTIKEAIVSDLKQDIKLSAGYDIAFNDVRGLVPNLIDLSKYKSPLLEVVDTGNETQVARSSSKYLYTWDIILRGSTKVNQRVDISEDINKMTSAVKQWIDGKTSTDIHANVLDIQFEGITASGQIEGTNYSAVEISTRFIYYIGSDF